MTQKKAPKTSLPSPLALSVAPISELDTPDAVVTPDAHEVYDEADQASMIQMAENAQALAKIKARLAPEKHPDFDGKTCIGCADDIPQLRLDMGKIRCVHCQSALEIKDRMYSPRDD